MSKKNSSPCYVIEANKIDFDFDFDFDDDDVCVQFFVTLFLIFCLMLGISIWAFVARNGVEAHTVRIPHER
jgi:hypothetical protein